MVNMDAMIKMLFEDDDPSLDALIAAVMAEFGGIEGARRLGYPLLAQTYGYPPEVALMGAFVLGWIGKTWQADGRLDTKEEKPNASD